MKVTPGFSNAHFLKTDSDGALALQPHPPPGELTASPPLTTGHRDAFSFVVPEDPLGLLLQLTKPRAGCIPARPGTSAQPHTCSPRVPIPQAEHLHSYRRPEQGGKGLWPPLPGRLEHAWPFQGLGIYQPKAWHSGTWKRRKTYQIYHRIVFSIHFLRISESRTGFVYQRHTIFYLLEGIQQLHLPAALCT